MTSPNIVEVTSSRLPMATTQRLYGGEEYSFNTVYTPSISSPSYSEVHSGLLHSPRPLCTPMSSTFSNTPGINGSPSRRYSAGSYGHDSGSNASSSASTPGSDASHADGYAYARDSTASDIVVPKMEPMDEDIKMPSVEVVLPSPGAAPGATSSTATTRYGPIRRRGRPKKEISASSASSAQPKPTAGRSKTGCRTCRRRKKKCDEGKPGCESCKKNSVVCEGYEPLRVWQGERQPRPPIHWPSAILGAENDLDRVLLKHFENDLCDRLLSRSGKSTFLRDVIVPMSMSHEGLMHSLLCLSGSHMLSQSEDEAIRARTEWHRSRVVNDLLSLPNDGRVDDPTMAQVTLTSLNALLAPDIVEQYSLHMETLKAFSEHQTHQSDNPAFRQFIIGYCHLYKISKCVTALTPPTTLPMPELNVPEEFLQQVAGPLIGYLDPLFYFISKIRRLRDCIRERSHVSLGEILEIQADISSWNNPHRSKPSSSAYIASELYIIAARIYLFRTIRPSREYFPTTEPSELQRRLHYCISKALEILHLLDPDDPIHGSLLMPLFLMGCATFNPEQRPPISRAFATLRRFDVLEKNNNAETIVNQVWGLMDERDESSWDWEKIIKESNLDFSLV
ncbi:hypothetical protein EJ05DRAFT_499138 [Pseudovirgaria hyperparasitica]|uniref:Zn(2)-C6 fungal-type domain-containing protein n=1 Tax=Pseudovirgaria hyperparasitica TaxID=470096 RepID=A0A6A6WAQ7_9PEZI|nr:uncharacterized protein EJ05DRAFT_499138 [Pseudovirgaria hyperparasitica]KAF2759948.1 hypothetical protein EJ05DRAFT_499138 [Pseudovirgaria hyperparasitica]